MNQHYGDALQLETQPKKKKKAKEQKIAFKLTAPAKLLLSGKGKIKGF